ncbi:hypothetical protein PF005_g19265 [Phytophthora fragariae]|uniref:Uncharacterized protein n=1 Tax=Phytophthora fragariae TaxID=53985 RepID=A0A6A3R814_9STRA|nr:hypothetical protein PF009_g19610 [Phytophthora fragariae]KAE8991992.1 hypothetical protein PF011_g17720 [Phytophthora fragariae]KAE9091675.1 hypothetical protein PF010_g18100 [Phytophthora fragariae]KAE9091758.1 hypothetical protein PF007_g18762 [Phytophthora fragariae]KAE9120804.1 hypothetical protein PF006_g18046 [Phytophthora fragariae]
MLRRFPATVLGLLTKTSANKELTATGWGPLSSCWCAASRNKRAKRRTLCQLES